MMGEYDGRSMIAVEWLVQNLSASLRPGCDSLWLAIKGKLDVHRRLVEACLGDGIETTY